MRGVELKSLSLKEIPLKYFGGENSVLTNDRNVIFPSVVKSYHLNHPITNLIDGVVVNSIFIAVNKLSDVYSVKVFNLNSRTLIIDITTLTYAGIVFAGNKLYVFYDGNKVLAIDTVLLSTQTLKITVNGAYQNIVKVKSITSQAFVMITTSPTTVHVNSIIDLLSLSPTKTDLLSLTYSVQTTPTKNVNVFYHNGVLYVFGDDGTSIISLEVRDLVYLKTEKVYYYKYLPIEKYITFSVFGENVSVQNIFSNDIIEVENKSENLRFFIDLSQDFIYFGNRYKYFGKYVFDAIEGNLYEIGFTGEIVENILFDLHYRFSVKLVEYDINTLFKIEYKVDTIFSPQPIRFQIESKYHNAYTTYSYQVQYKRNSFIANVKGDTFVIHITPKTYLRIVDLNFIYAII